MDENPLKQWVLLTWGYLSSLYWPVNPQCHCTSTPLPFNSTGNGHIQEGCGGLIGSDDRVCLEYLPVICAGITLHEQTAGPPSDSTGCRLGSNKWAKLNWSGGNIYWFHLGMFCSTSVKQRPAGKQLRPVQQVLCVVLCPGAPTHLVHLHSATSAVDVTLCHVVPAIQLHSCRLTLLFGCACVCVDTPYLSENKKMSLTLNTEFYCFTCPLMNLTCRMWHSTFNSCSATSVLHYEYMIPAVWDADDAV